MSKENEPEKSEDKKEEKENQQKEGILTKKDKKNKKKKSVNWDAKNLEFNELQKHYIQLQ